MKSQWVDCAELILFTRQAVKAERSQRKRAELEGRRAHETSSGREVLASAGSVGTNDHPIREAEAHSTVAKGNTRVTLTNAAALVGCPPPPMDNVAPGPRGERSFLR